MASRVFFNTVLTLNSAMASALNAGRNLTLHLSPKPIPAPMETETIHTLQEQSPALDKEIAKNSGTGGRLNKPLKPLPTATTIKLTRCEQEILNLVAEGRTSKSIAEQLGRSARTIERHRANLLKKFSQKNSVSLIQAAMHHCLL